MVYRYAIHGIQQDGGTSPYQKVRKAEYNQLLLIKIDAKS